MTNLPSNPLQSLLAMAAKTLPAESGATARFRRRIDADGPSVILADVSGSMGSMAWGGHRKIDVLREAVASVAAGRRIVAFSSTACEVAAVPESPGGGTAMHVALDYAARWSPGHTLVVSDGEPDSESAALAAAERLSGQIDVLYIGPDSNRTAMDFLSRLARAGAGSYRAADMHRQPPAAIAAAMQALLPAPRR